MASGSTHHTRLLEAIERLRVALLPDPFDPIGTYASPDDVHIRAVSFRVLVHAEAETYLEDVANMLFQEAWLAWEQRGIPSQPVVSMLAFSGREHGTPPSSLKDVKDKDAKICVQKAQATWRYAHHTNNGLKEDSVLRLLLPLGILPSSIDPTLLSDLSSFGVLRGAVVHTSATRVTQYADPETEYKKVKQLAADLLNIDKLVQYAILQVQAIDAALIALGPP